MPALSGSFAAGCLAVSLAAAPDAAAPAAPASRPAPADIVVSASRDRRDARRMAAHVTVLETDQLDEAGAATLVDALQDLAGLYFRSTAGSGNPTQAELSMRGFGENSHGRVLVLLDGQRLNCPDMAGLNWAQIPLSAVERVEVLRGGQTALYGDYAVGGVINIVTRQGAAEPERDASLLAGSYGRTAVRAGAVGTAGPARYAANAERQAADGYRERSAYRTWGGGGSLGMDVFPRLALSLRTDYNALDYEMPGYLTRAQMEADPRQSRMPDDSASSGLGTVQLRAQSLCADELRLDLGLDYRRTRRETDMASWASYSDTTVDSLSAAPRAAWKHALAGRENRILAGFDAAVDWLEADRYGDAGRAAAQVQGRIHKLTAGAYLRDEFELAQPLLLGLGARHERARIGAAIDSAGARTVDDHKVHRADALDASLVYAWGPDNTLFARAATLYRFPFVDEQVSYIGYETDTLYEDLDRERGRMAEAGATLSLGSAAQASLTLFRLEMRDEIAYNAFTGRNENLDDTRRQGVEAQAAWTWPGAVRWTARYTGHDAAFTGGEHDGRTVPLVPGHQASLGARWTLPLGFTLESTAAYVGSQRLGGDYANDQERLEAFTRLDLAVRYAPPWLARRTGVRLEAMAGLDNVLDKRYADVGYLGWVEGAFTGVYYPSPGRTWKAGLSVRF